MTPKEKEILKALVKHPNGELSPVDFINGIANRDYRSVQNLKSKGYINTVPHQNKDLNGNYYNVPFYYATDKGLAVCNSWHKRFLFNIKTQPSLYIGIGSISIGIFAIIASVFIALYVPYYQKFIKQESAIQSIYKDILTNQDIFISNTNNKRYLAQTSAGQNLPEFYIISNPEDDIRTILQEKFGLVQYRWFLYYLQQTQILNDEIEAIKTQSIIQGINKTSLEYFNAQKAYINTMDYLAKDMDLTKFNYQKDTGCLAYFFEQSFPYLNIDHRGKSICENESISRLSYHFSYLPDLTPLWLKDQLKNVFNKKQSGLGDQIVN